MQVILQGSLRHFPPADLLVFLAGRGQGGTLDLESTGRRTRILFDGEKVLWAESSRGGEVRDVVLDAFDWTAGSFTLLDSAALPENAGAVALDLTALIEESRRRAASFADNTLFRVVEDPLQQQVSLTADDLRLLFRLAAGKSFKELVAEIGSPRTELTERLRNLMKLGLITTAVPEEAMAVADAKTAPGLKPAPRRRTLVGSLTPDHAPDNVYPLLDAEHTIGRAPANSIPIGDGSVSSNHARILRTEDGFVLEDLQSRNGTFVNGEKVTDKRLLVDGDLIRVGKIIMTFNVARESKTTDSTQPEVRVV